MIIGAKYCERVRLMQIELKLAVELIETVRNDLEKIAAKLRDEGIIDTTDYPYMRLYHDIGRCSGYLQNVKKYN